MEAPVARYACASLAPFDRIPTPRDLRTMRIKGPGVGDSAAVLTIGVNATVGKSASIMCNLRLQLLVRYILFKTFDIVFAKNTCDSEAG